VRKERKKRKIFGERKAERGKNVFCNATKQKRSSQCRKKQINIEINSFEKKRKLKNVSENF
jgi:hypothetical protein